MGNSSPGGNAYLPGGGSSSGFNPAAPTLIVIAGHQSNMTGAQMISNGATLTAADAAITGLDQYSPNGAGTPALALTLLPAQNQLLFPAQTTSQNTVGPSLAYCKAVQAANPGNQVVLITAGVGGTSCSQWVAGQPFFDSMAAAFQSLIGVLTNYTVHSIILSPMENEMINNFTPSQASTDLNNCIAAYRAIANMPSNVPIYMASAVPEYVASGMQPFYLIYVVQAKAAVTNVNVGLAGGLTPNAFISGETVHYTNASNRTRGAALANQPPLVSTFNASAAPQVTSISLSQETLTFTSVGVPYYDIQWQIGAGAWTSTDFAILGDNSVGAVITAPMPGTGTRNCRIVAKAKGGDATPSSTVTYTLPVATVPARNIELDINGSSVDGSGNLISVNSIGTDTTSWTPASSSGTAAAALIKRVAQNAKNIALIDSASKRFQYPGTLPSGDYSVAFPFQYDALPSNGVLLGWSQASVAGDIFIDMVNGGSDFNIRHNNAGTTQLSTTNGNLYLQLGKWQLLVVTYARTANVATFYLNGNPLSTTGTLQQRSATPVTNTTTDVNGFNTVGTGNGMPLIELPTFMHWTSVLTQAQISVLKDSLQTTYGLTFGFF